MRLVFIHTSSILNLRGSERWLLDIVSLMKAFSVQVQVVNFDYDQKYGTDRDEIKKRRKMVKESLGGTPFAELSALRLSLPLRITPLGKATTRTLNRYLNFIPISSRFFRSLRSSDVIYFLQVNRRPIHLLVILILATLAGRKRVIGGVHVTPEYTSLQVRMLRFFVRIGVLTGIHVVSQTQVERIRSMLGCRTDYVPNGIFLERFANRQDSKNRSEFSVLFVGAMTSVKGADFLPAIDENLRKRNIPFKLQICTSGGHLSKSIQDWASTRPEVSFLGFVAQEELARIYKVASVLILPSRRELFGLACIEALARGTPVVVSQAEGFRQTVIDGYNGYTAQSFSPEAFSDELLKVYNLWSRNRPQYDDLCRNGREYVTEHFRWQNLQKEFVLLINNACKTTRPVKVDTGRSPFTRKAASETDQNRKASVLHRTNCRIIHD